MIWIAGRLIGIYDVDWIKYETWLNLLNYSWVIIIIDSGGTGHSAAVALLQTKCVVHCHCIGVYTLCINTSGYILLNYTTL